MYLYLMNLCCVGVIDEGVMVVKGSGPPWKAEVCQRREKGTSEGQDKHGGGKWSRNEGPCLFSAFVSPQRDRVTLKMLPPFGNKVTAIN